MPKPIQAPKDLAELMANPQRVKDAFTLLNAVANFQATIEAPTTSNSFLKGKAALQGDSPSLTLRLPLKFSAAIQDPLNNITDTNAAVKSILAGLRANGMLPN